MNIGNMLVIAVVGLCVVFLILVILMCAIFIMTALFKKFGGKKKETAPSAPAPAPEKAEPVREKAPGSCGELELIKTSEREAAMVMAIVADELGVPLNTLRFKKIEMVGE